MELDLFDKIADKPRTAAELAERELAPFLGPDGAARAAAWLMAHDTGLFDMQDVLGLKD